MKLDDELKENWWWAHKDDFLRWFPSRSLETSGIV
jgi:hypothetical protein